MAYCRGPVYCYFNGDEWEVHLERVNTAPHVSRHTTYFVDAPEALHELLLELRAAGLDVPQSAVDRIRREISEGKWETKDNAPD